MVPYECNLCKIIFSVLDTNALDASMLFLEIQNGPSEAMIKQLTQLTCVSLLPSYRSQRPVCKLVAFLLRPATGAQTRCLLTAPRAQCTNMLPSYPALLPVRKSIAFLPRPVPTAQIWCLLTTPRARCANLLPSCRAPRPVHKLVSFLPRPAFVAQSYCFLQLCPDMLHWLALP